MKKARSTPVMLVRMRGKRIYSLRSAELYIVRSFQNNKISNY